LKASAIHYGFRQSVQPFIEIQQELGKPDDSAHLMSAFLFSLSIQVLK
jgi:hypothetical protein